MPPVDVSNADIAQLAAEIQAGRLSPVDVTESYLSRVERLDPALNAYITVTRERALSDARRAQDEIAAGRYRGPLHGIPIGLKDLYATAGIRTTAGAKILGDWVPEADSTVTRRLSEAGTVLLGKLNTHEFAYGGTTNNPHYGPTRNPWNRDCIPGGSSGGSGAAVAAGLAAAAMGSDTAGSIRIPASLCGVVGLMPTYGRVSKAGVVPLSWSFDHAGPLTRTVEDAALILGAIAGYDPADSSTVPMPVPEYTDGLRAGVQGLCVGVARHYFFDLLDDEVRAAVETAIEQLAKLGATVRDVDIAGIEAAVEGRGHLSNVESRLYHEASLRTRPKDFGADVLALLSREQPDARTVVEGMRACAAAAEEMRRTLTEVDALVTPTMPVVAPRIGQETVTVGSQELPIRGVLLRCTAPFNAAHLPALSLPCGFSAGGLPIGLQIAGRPFDEATVLRVAHAYEQATDWHLHRPAGLEA